MPRAAVARARLAMAAALFAAAWTVSACKPMPTEPTPGLHLTVDVGAGGSGTGGTLTVRANVCACSRTSLYVAIDGADVGQVGCGQEVVFTVASGQHQLRITSATLSAALNATIVVTADAGAIVRISCA